MRWLLRLSDWLRHKGRLRSGSAAHAWGRRGEDIAHRYLRAQGYIIVARNHRTRGGTAEADIIARDGDALVFIEVKTRANADFGTPDRAVDAEKQQKIARAAADYTYRSESSWENARFDIVSVLFGEREQVDHIRDAFRPPNVLI